jgi:hypothetical protein
MFRLFRQFLGFILLVATVGLATCQSVVKADTATDVKTVNPVTVTKL